MIPRRLHRIWVGSRLPDEFAGYWRTWRSLHPTWELIEWDDERLDVLPMVNRHLYVAADEYAPNNVGQFKADVARYEILWHYGGVYVDADLEPRKALDPLLGRDVDLFAAWEVENRWINNAILGARGRHPFVADLISNLSASVEGAPGATPNVTTGPQYLTRRYRSVRPIMTIAPARQFYPYGWNELDRAGEDFPDAYAVHRWNNRRSRRRPS